jgi:hypothetical protein
MTATTLLASVRRRASIPSTSTTGSADADLLAYANEELQRRLVAEILEKREEHFVFNSDQTIGSSTKFRIPSRAIGGRLRGVWLLDSDGEVMDKVDRIEPEREGDYSSADGLFGIRVEGWSVHLVGGSSTTATTIRLKYYLRPNDLTTTAANYATVATATGSTVTLTTSGAHGFTTSSSLDFVKAGGGYESQFIAQAPSSASGSDLAFSSLTSADYSLAAGDYVCVAGYSPVPQIPAEFHDILAQRTACRWLEANGDRQGLQVAAQTLQQMEADVGIIITPRVESSPQKIINRSGVLGGWRGRR